MKLKPGELAENHFTLIDTLPHSEMIAFVRKYVQKNTLFSILYTAFTLIFFILWLFVCALNFRNGHLTIPQLFLYNGMGFLIAMAVIPLHEFIHATAYRLRGAEHTSFEADFKKFIFLAIADKFVASKRDTQLIALAPFAVLSVAMVVLLCFATPQMGIAIVTALMLHTMMCCGDFAMLSYLDSHADKEVVSYDDKENKISYFYGRIKQVKI